MKSITLAKCLRLPSILIYVEFGAAFPFNGGELIYVSLCITNGSLGYILTKASWMRQFDDQSYTPQSYFRHSSF
jgi:hypothetical protein